jgi:hypothetical protein
VTDIVDDLLSPPPRTPDRVEDARVVEGSAEELGAPGADASRPSEEVLPPADLDVPPPDAPSAQSDAVFPPADIPPAQDLGRPLDDVPAPPEPPAPFGAPVEDRPAPPDDMPPPPDDMPPPSDDMPPPPEDLPPVTDEMAAVADEPFEEPPPPPDDELVDAVRRKLSEQPGLLPNTVDLEALSGVVILRGEAKHRETIEELGRRATAVAGVREVRNLLHLPGEPPPRPSGAR